MKNFVRLLTVLLAVCLVGGLLPTLTFAAPKYDDSLGLYLDEYLGSSTSSKIVAPPTGFYAETSYRIPRNSPTLLTAIIDISAKAFMGSTYLQTVTFDEDSLVTEIGDLAFADCTSLTSIVLPKKLRRIGYGAFEDCAALEGYLTISGDTEVQSNSFVGCTNPGLYLKIELGEEDYLNETFGLVNPISFSYATPKGIILHDAGLVTWYPWENITHGRYKVTLYSTGSLLPKEEGVWYTEERVLDLAPYIAEEKEYYCTVQMVQKEGLNNGVADSKPAVTDRKTLAPLPKATVVTTKAELRTALADAETDAIEVKGSFDASGITNETIPITVKNGYTLTLSDNTTADLTIEEGATLVLADVDNYGFVLDGTLVNNGTVTRTYVRGGTWLIAADTVNNGDINLGTDNKCRLVYNYGCLTNNGTIPALGGNFRCNIAALSTTAPTIALDQTTATVGDEMSFTITGLASGIEDKLTDFADIEWTTSLSSGLTDNTDATFIVPAKLANYKLGVEVNFKNSAGYYVYYKKNNSNFLSTTTSLSVSYSNGPRVSPAPVKESEISWNIGDYTYNGQAIKPVPTVEVEGKTVSNVYYDLSYENNINAGENTAKVTITFKGNYASSGSFSKNFTIKPRVLEFTWNVDYPLPGFVFNGKKPNLTAVVYTPTATSLNVEVLGLETQVGGPYTATVQVSGDATVMANHTLEGSTTKEQAYNILQRALDHASMPVTVEISDHENLVYNGEEQTVTVSVTDPEQEGLALVEGVDYTVAYENNINAGTAKVTVTGIGNFSSSVVRYFTIAPKPVLESEVPVPAPTDVTYGQTLAASTLSGGWEWEDSTVIPTVGNTGYRAIYPIADDDNYDWSAILGYDSANSRLVRTVTPHVDPLAVVIAWSEDEFDFNNQPKFVTATVSNALAGDLVTPILSGHTATAEGPYTATVIGLDGADASNYTLSGGSNLTLNWKINPCKHHGGTATCLTQATCDWCQRLYGEKDPDNHESDAFDYVSNEDDTHEKSHACCGAIADANEACHGGKATYYRRAICDDCGGYHGDRVHRAPVSNKPAVDTDKNNAPTGGTVSLSVYGALLALAWMAKKKK